MIRLSHCPNCQSKSLFVTKTPVSAGGGHAPNHLPGLGTFWGLRAARFDVVVCGDCGLTRFFAPEHALGRLQDSPEWEHVVPQGGGRRWENDLER
jgi:predicted nucleic-acid-binding Zn-ribbon protein